MKEIKKNLEVEEAFENLIEELEEKEEFYNGCGANLCGADGGSIY